MLYIIVILFNLIFCCISFATPTDTKVNQWVDIALKIDIATIHSQTGRYYCESTKISPVYGTTLNIAHGSIILICIKSYCHQIESEIHNKIEHLKSFSREQLLDLLTSIGRSHQLNQINSNLRKGNHGQNLYCSNSQFVRNFVYDTCVNQLYKCN